MPRIIRSFHKDNEAYSDEIILPEIDVKILRKHFGIEDCNDPLYDCFPLGLEDIEFLSAYTSYSFDFQKFDYFLEYDA